MILWEWIVILICIKYTTGGHSTLRNSADCHNCHDWVVEQGATEQEIPANPFSFSPSGWRSFSRGRSRRKLPLLARLLPNYRRSPRRTTLVRSGSTVWIILRNCTLGFCGPSRLNPEFGSEFKIFKIFAPWLFPIGTCSKMRLITNKKVYRLRQDNLILVEIVQL